MAESTHATASPATSASDRRRWFAIVAILGLVLYGLTCAPGVLWQDSATFQYRVYFTQPRSELGLALAHPLYILLAKAFAAIPLSSDYAFRVNLFSAVCAAICLGFLTDFLLSLTRSKLAAVTGMLLLAVSHTFWRHAVLAEVYSLYGLLLVIELWCLQRFFDERGSRWLMLAFLLNGLNASTHLLALLHLPAYGGVVIYGIRRHRISLRHLPLLAFVWIVGSSPYSSLIVGDVVGGRAVAETLRSALFGEAYAEKVLNLTFASGAHVIRTGQFFALNFPTPLILAAPLGAWIAWKGPQTRWFAMVGGCIFIVSFGFAYRYRVPDQYVFFFPCYVLIPIFVGLAVSRVSLPAASRRAACVILAGIPALVYEIAPTILTRWDVQIGSTRDLPYRDSYAYFLRPRKNADDGAARYARELLQDAAPDGLLIADSTIMNMLAYVRDVEGVCPGVALSRSADVTPKPPAVALEREAIAPFVERRRAFLCAASRELVPDWLIEQYDLRPNGPVLEIIPP